MGLMSMIFGTAGVVDGIKEGIDKSILTSEERLDYHKELLKAYEPFKLIQRVLAIAITSMFAFHMLLLTILVLLGTWYPELNEVAIIINDMETTSMVGYSFMAVVTLFFSGGVLDSFNRRK